MRKSVDPKTGAQLYQLALPANSTLWFSTQRLQCPHGELSASIAKDVLTSASLKVYLPQDALEQLAEEYIAGIEEVDTFRPGMLIEVEMHLNLDICEGLCELFTDIVEPMELLSILQESLPALLNLELYQVARIEQSKKRITGTSTLAKGKG